MHTIIVSDLGLTRREKRIVDFAFTYLQKIPKENRYRHISVLTDKNDIIEWGFNQEHVLPDGKPLGFLSVHSEFAVIKKFLRRYHEQNIKYYDLFNLRIDRYNQLKMSRPCRRCSYFLGIFKPKRVFYSNQDGFFETFS